MPSRMALKDTIKAPSRPPKLRTGTARKRCSFCRHYDGKGTCRAYNAKVRPNDLCESYSPGTEPEKGR